MAIYAVRRKSDSDYVYATTDYTDAELTAEVLTAEQCDAYDVAEQFVGPIGNAREDDAYIVERVQ